MNESMMKGKVVAAMDQSGIYRTVLETGRTIRTGINNQAEKSICGSELGFGGVGAIECQQTETAEENNKFSELW